MRRIALFATILTLTAGELCHAGRVELYVGGGADAAVGELAKRSDIGFHTRFAVGLGLTNTPLSDIKILATVGYLYFAADVPTDGDREILSVGPELRIGIPNHSQTELYLLVGAGMARVKRLRRTTTSTETLPTGPVEIERKFGELSEDDLCLSFGVAALAKWGEAQPFVEFRYTDISGRIIKDIQFVSLTVGLRF